MLVLTEAEYLDHTDQYLGYCEACNEITAECVEPDAEGYKCPRCYQHTVMGIEQALLLGKIEIGNE